MRMLLVLLSFLFFVPVAQAAETVVLLHGIARTALSLSAVEKALKKEGYDVLPVTYPSRQKNVDDIAGWLRQSALDDEFWSKAEKVHFVTHSMGGVVAQQYLDQYRVAIPVEKLGRVVMLAPPNGGSEVADLLHDFWPYKWYYGPAGSELTTEARQKAVVEPYYDLGVIAGTKEWPYVIAAFVVPGSSDGRVSVEKTKIPGMKDHVTVPATHTFIMDKPDVHRQVVAFIKDGVFIRK